jgi:hypothetical protein
LSYVLSFQHHFLGLQPNNSQSKHRDGLLLQREARFDTKEVKVAVVIGDEYHIQLGSLDLWL